MKLVFAEQAWEDYLYWQQQDKRVVTRIHELTKDAVREPFGGNRVFSFGWQHEVSSSSV